MGHGRALIKDEIGDFLVFLDSHSIFLVTGVALTSHRRLLVFSVSQSDSSSVGGCPCFLDSENSVDQSLELILLVRSKDKSTFCVVPVFLTILPGLSVLAIVITFTKLLLNNCLILKMVFLSASCVFVSDSHGMTTNYFGRFSLLGINATSSN